MSALTRLHLEAIRLLTIYEEYKDSDDEFLRRKAYVELDRFLMANRETAIMLMVKGLQTEIDAVVETKRRVPWYKKLLKGGASNGNDNHNSSDTIHSKQ